MYGYCIVGASIRWTSCLQAYVWKSFVVIKWIINNTSILSLEKQYRTRLKTYNQKIRYELFVNANENTKSVDSYSTDAIF